MNSSSEALRWFRGRVRKIGSGGSGRTEEVATFQYKCGTHKAWDRGLSQAFRKDFGTQNLFLAYYQLNVTRYVQVWRSEGITVEKILSQ